MPDARIQTVDTVQALQARIDSLQRTRLDSRLLPTHEALADLLPAGGLQEGAVYTLSPSSALTMALLTGPSAAGAWCGVVGMPEFGIEAAEAMGIDLDRLVLVPHPGEQWLTVTAAIADALSVIAVRRARRERRRDREARGARAPSAARRFSWPVPGRRPKP